MRGRCWAASATPATSASSATCGRPRSPRSSKARIRFSGLSSRAASPHSAPTFGLAAPSVHEHRSDNRAHHDGQCEQRPHHVDHSHSNVRVASSLCDVGRVGGVVGDLNFLADGWDGAVHPHELSRGGGALFGGGHDGDAVGGGRQGGGGGGGAIFGGELDGDAVGEALKVGDGRGGRHAV